MPSLRIPAIAAAMALVSSPWLLQPAFADPATEEGARALEAAYAAYFSPAAVERGIVSVAPDGEAYRVTWRLQKAIDIAGGLDGALTIEPLVYRLIPGPGGVWKLEGDHLPRIVFNVPTDKGRASGAMDFSGFKAEGRYDPAQTEFLVSTIGINTLQGAFEIVDQSQRSNFKVDEDGITVETRVKPAADGAGVDVAVAQAFKGMESISAPPVGGGDPVEMNYAISGAVGGAVFTGLRAREISELWKFVVAHSGEDPLPPALQPELRQKLSTALPFWNDMNAHAEIHDLAIAMPAGEARMKTLGESLSVTGFAAAGLVKLGLDVEDLTLKSEIAPPWANAFWPATLHLALRASGEGWDKAARAVLDDPHFGEEGDLSPETEAAVTAILAAGHPKVAIQPGYLKTPVINLTFEGEASTETGEAVGHLRLTADSLDKTIELMQEIGKTLPDAQSAVLAISLIKELAKTGDDGRLVWEIESKDNGEITVNGASMPIGK